MFSKRIQVFFALRSKNLIIRSRCGPLTLELIPHRLLVGDLPTFFVEDHAHWMDLESGTIELRAKDNPWNHDDSNWYLQFHPEAFSIMNRRSLHLLIDVRSKTAAMIAARLQPLEASRYLTILR